MLFPGPYLKLILVIPKYQFWWDKVWLSIGMELSFPTYYMVIYKTIHVYYLNKSHDIYSPIYSPITWIITHAKLLYIVLYAWHLDILIWSYILQCQCAISYYLIFQITIGGREILMTVNTMPDGGGSGTTALMSPMLYTIISCYLKCLWWTVSRSQCHGETWTNVGVQWQKSRRRTIWCYSVGASITCYNL